MSRIFIDTGYIVALISRRDEYHERAVALARKYQGTPAITTYPILLEVGNALARHYRQQASEIIDLFHTSNDVEIVQLDSDLFERALTLYKSHQDKEWGLVDCISFVVMSEAGCTAALTFDKHFEQAGFRIL